MYYFYWLPIGTDARVPRTPWVTWSLVAANIFVFAAIHLTPEAADGGPIARLRDGDVIRIDATTGRLEALVAPAEWAARAPATADLSHSHAGLGRELFAGFRAGVSAADSGASVLGFLPGN